jgi:asparagine synthase (glutamine-hydrolysing)
MCGLVGAMVLGDSSYRIEEPYLAIMRDRMTHRGPDGGASWISADRRVGLGHRRLSIIDLSAKADQPMSSANGRFQLVFNGEIYNHADIRTELERLSNRPWKTDHSDTEVILRAFEQWGIDCLHKFRGMFAFALWDEHERELWLVRDRIGIKPLYYSQHHGRIVFASEIKALLADPQQQRAINEEALFDYLSFLTTPAPHTLFAGVQKLAPGTWMRVRADGHIEQRNYWDVLDHTTPLQGESEERIAEMLLAELRTAVKLRKVSDVPVGVFLSGGIDSSTNAALFSEGESRPVRTFSIGYDGNFASYQNELHYARQVATKFGAEHREKLLGIDDLIDFLPRMVYLQDEPIADPVCVPLYYVSKLARDNGVIVCQVGEGADELFCGYPAWQLQLRLHSFDRLPVPRFMKKGLLHALSATGRDGDFRYEILRRASLGQPLFWGGAEAFTQQQKNAMFSPRLRDKFAGRTSWQAIEPTWQRFKDKAWDPSYLNWMTYQDLNLRLPELLLMRVDKMSMGVSLEGRVPFLDHKFVELAMSIPAAVKTRNGTLKHILKKAVRGVIPDEIIDRKKQGFAVPVNEWFFDRVGEIAKRKLKRMCDETDLFAWPQIERLLNSDKRAQSWPLLNLAMWWETFIAADSPDRSPMASQTGTSP